jgi:hypothetical protein
MELGIHTPLNAPVERFQIWQDYLLQKNVNHALLDTIVLELVTQVPLALVPKDSTALAAHLYRIQLMEALETDVLLDHTV